MKCSRPTCPKNEWLCGLCRGHYFLELNNGVRGKTDAAPAREHVQKLLDLNWTYQGIAEAAGVAMSQVWHLAHDRELALVVTVKAVLSVPLLPGESSRQVDSTGTRRRVDAMRWMGHRISDLSVEIGLASSTLNTIIYRPTLSAFVAVRVARIYPPRAATSGPSRIAAARARQRGCLPPIVWDYTDIDDPRSRPFQGFYKESA